MLHWINVFVILFKISKNKLEPCWGSKIPPLPLFSSNSDMLDLFFFLNHVTLESPFPPLWHVLVHSIGSLFRFWGELWYDNHLNTYQGSETSSSSRVSPVENDCYGGHSFWRKCVFPLSIWRLKSKRTIGPGSQHHLPILLQRLILLPASSLSILLFSPSFPLSVCPPHSYQIVPKLKTII